MYERCEGLPAAVGTQALPKEHQAGTLCSDGAFFPADRNRQSQAPPWLSSACLCLAVSTPQQTRDGNPALLPSSRSNGRDSFPSPSRPSSSRHPAATCPQASRPPAACSPWDSSGPFSHGSSGLEKSRESCSRTPRPVCVPLCGHRAEWGKEQREPRLQQHMFMGSGLALCITAQRHAGRSDGISYRGSRVLQGWRCLGVAQCRN